MKQKKKISYRKCFGKKNYLNHERREWTIEKYIKLLEKDQFTKVRGIAIPNLKVTQAQNKKLKEIKGRPRKALYFSKLFGFDLDSSRLKDLDTSNMYSVDFHTERVQNVELYLIFHKMTPYLTHHMVAKRTP